MVQWLQSSGWNLSSIIQSYVCTSLDILYAVSNPVILKLLHIRITLGGFQKPRSPGIGIFFKRFRVISVSTQGCKLLI